MYVSLVSVARFKHLAGKTALRNADLRYWVIGSNVPIGCDREQFLCLDSAAAFTVLGLFALASLG